MRFVLDQDTPVSIRRFLQGQGHDCWTADEAGLAEADDDDLAQYAQDKNAIMVSHDEEFAARRKRRTFGIHVWLRCHQVRGLEVLSECFDAIEPHLAAGKPCVLELTVDGGFRYHPAQWDV